MDYKRFSQKCLILFRIPSTLSSMPIFCSEAVSSVDGSPSCTHFLKNKQGSLFIYQYILQITIYQIIEIFLISFAAVYYCSMCTYNVYLTCHLFLDIYVVSKVYQ